MAHKYRAFISYSQADLNHVGWLHRALESYRVPKSLVGTNGPDGPIPPTLFPIFRDREDLASSPSASAAISAALAESASLIVVCSPSAVSSRWVNDEIVAYKRLGRADRIFAVIVAGEPNASDDPAKAGNECFPPALRYKLDSDGQSTGAREQPIAADLRPSGDGRDNAKLKLIAAILGVSFDALKQREVEAARRRARIAQIIAGAMACLALLAAGAAGLAYLTSGVATDRLAKNKIAQTRMIMAMAPALNPAAAASLLLAAVPKRLENPDRPLVPEALARLSWAVDQLDALGDKSIAAGEGRQIANSRLARDGVHLLIVTGPTPRVSVRDLNKPEDVIDFDFSAEIRDADISPDGRQIAVTLRVSDDPVHVFDVATRAEKTLPFPRPDTPLSVLFSASGKYLIAADYTQQITVWEAGANTSLFSYRFDADIYDLYSGPTDETIVVKLGGDQIVYLDMALRKERWRIDGKRFLSFSPDGTAAFVDIGKNTAVAIDVETGNVLQRAAYPWLKDGLIAGFSSDGSRVLIEQNGTQFDLFDSTDGRRLAHVSADQIVFGLSRYAHVTPDGKTVLLTVEGSTVIKVTDIDTSTFDLRHFVGAEVAGVSLDAAGEKVLIAAEDGRVAVFNRSSLSWISETQIAVNNLRLARLSREGSHIVTVGDSGGSLLSSDLKPIRALELPEGTTTVRAVADDDLAHVLLFLSDGRVLLWATRDIQPRFVYQVDPSLLFYHRDASSLRSLVDVWISPNGARAAFRIGIDVHFYDIATGKSLAVVALDTTNDVFFSIRTAEFDRIGEQFAVAAGAHGLELISPETGKMTQLLRIPGTTVQAAHFFGEGEEILVTAAVGAVLLVTNAYVMKSETGEVVSVLQDRGAVSGVAAQIATVVPLGPDAAVGLTAGDGSVPFVGDLSRTFTIWDRISGFPMRGVRGGLKDQSSSIATPRVVASASGAAAIFLTPEGETILADTSVRRGQEVIDYACKRVAHVLDPRQQELLGLRADEPTIAENRLNVLTSWLPWLVAENPPSECP